MSDNQLISKRLRFDTGSMQSEFHYRSENEGTFIVHHSGGMVPDGYTETVAINMARIRDGIYLVSWIEASGATVTHLLDLENSTLYSNVTINGGLHNFTGTIEALD